MPAYDFNFVPQTEPDAVNQMLMSIGQSPVNTLTVVGIKTVNIARLVLHNTSREVQGRGWNFNTDDKYPLAPTSAGTVVLPSNALSVDPCDTRLRYVERRNVESGDRCFYDKDARSFTISKSVDCDIVWFFEFEDLPQAARAHIAHKAGRVFQASSVASQVIHEFTKEREIETLAELDRDERRTSDSNMFAHDSLATRIFLRY